MCIIWVFSYAKAQKNSNLFFTNCCLILASVYNSNDVWVKQWLWHSLPKNACTGLLQSVHIQVISFPIVWNVYNSGGALRKEVIIRILFWKALFIKKERWFVEDVLFYHKDKAMPFPKIEVKWDGVGNVYVYIKSDAVIWFWQYCHVRTHQTSEN